MEEVKKPSERLIELADLFAVRNADYGSDYKEFGDRLKALFPNGVRLATTDEFRRFAILVMMVGKISRYVNNFTRGGHPDSLADLSVYAQMLAEIDEEVRSGTTPGHGGTDGAGQR